MLVFQGMFSLKLKQLFSVPNLTWRPVKIPSCQKMKMDMKDGLSCGFFCIENNSEPVFQSIVFTNFSNNIHQFPHKKHIFFFYFCKIFDMFLGNNKNVNGGLRIDIVKSKNFLIFINNICRNLSFYNFTKNTVLRATSLTNLILPNFK